ncbi:hypothetical protein L218DRAFT_989527 [Marasmius fiardii PR-910]|nr:hypothetical protein L218DRAFT_989527 [Marasmius fiardii PR-910]
MADSVQSKHVTVTVLHGHPFLRKTFSSLIIAELDVNDLSLRPIFGIHQDHNALSGTARLPTFTQSLHVSGMVKFLVLTFDPSPRTLQKRAYAIQKRLQVDFNNDPKLSNLLAYSPLFSRLMNSSSQRCNPAPSLLLPPSLFILPRILGVVDPRSVGGDGYTAIQATYIPRLKDVVGELFWVVSGEDPWVLSSRVGYPLVRELLAGKGVMSEPLTPAPTPPPKEPEVGFRWEGGVMDIRRMSSSDGNGEMTEEEKEAEMEKMFGLLDRLERSGGPPGRTRRPGRPKAVSMIRKYVLMKNFVMNVKSL